MRKAREHSTQRVVGVVLVTLALACVVLFSVVRIRVEVRREAIDMPGFDFSRAVSAGKSKADLTALLRRDPGAINRAGLNGRFPIHDTAARANPSLARYLIANGADPNHRSREFIDLGGTALHVAVTSATDADEITPRHEETIALLHAHGADTSARDKADRTPIDIAREADAGRIVELLQRPVLGEQEANQRPRGVNADDEDDPSHPPVPPRTEHKDRQVRKDE